MHHLGFELAQQFAHIEAGTALAHDRFLQFAPAQNGVQTLLNSAFDRRGGDAVLGVVFHLLATAVFRDGDELGHALGDDIGKEVDLAVDVARRAARRLDERGLAAQVAFFVGVEDADERDFRQVEPFAQQVDADENVEFRRPQRPQYLDALNRIDVAVQVADFEADVAQVIGEVFRRALGERGDEDALLFLHPLAAKLDGFVDLMRERADGDLRIEQPRGPDDLLGNQYRARRVNVEQLHRLVGAREVKFPGERGGLGVAVGERLFFAGEIAGVAHDAVAQLEVRRGGAYVDELVGHLHELREPERAVVHGARQAEAVVDEHVFARAVAFIHAADLRHGGVGFVDDAEEIAREKVEQRERARAGRAAREMAGIVFDAAAKSHFLHHLQIKLRAHFDALGFQEPPVGLKPDHALVEFLADGPLRLLQFVVGGDELLGRVEDELGELRDEVAGERVEAREAVDLVAEKLDADGFLVGAGRVDLHHVAAHAEFAPGKGDVVALVEHVHELRQHGFAGDRLAHVQFRQHVQIILGRTQTVDARDAGDDDHVPPREQRSGGGKAQPLDLLVDGGIFFNVGVRARDVGLGLVVIEVADKIFDGVVGEELLELAVELGGEGLVMGDDQRGPLDLRDDIGDRERLP